MTGHASPPGQDVYPVRWGLWVTIGLLTVFLAGSIWLLVAGTDLGWRWPLVLLAAFLYPYEIWKVTGQLRRPRPSLHLDAEGIEGSFGREPWRNVTRVSYRWRLVGTTPMRRLTLELAPGTPDPAPSSREYASREVYTGGTVRGSRLELQPWGRKRRVLDDIRRYYTGPVDD